MTKEAPIQADGHMALGPELAAVHTNEVVKQMAPAPALMTLGAELCNQALSER